VLLNIRLLAIGAFIAGLVFFLANTLRILWFPVPLVEAAWLAALLAMMIHFNASKAWAAKPMIEAKFGSILSLQEARTPEAVSRLLRLWMMRPGGVDSSTSRLLPVRRTLWRDIIGFIPAYGIAFGAGLWLLLSLTLHYYHPEQFIPPSGSPFLGLLSTYVWCWLPAVSIIGLGVVADYVEDAVHLKYLTKLGEEPTKGLVRLGVCATGTKTVFCSIGMVGLVGAVLGLVALQSYRLLENAWPCHFQAGLMRHFPPAGPLIPALFGLAAAVAALVLIFFTVIEFRRRPKAESTGEG
jgi:hypothetical protein